MQVFFLEERKKPNILKRIFKKMEIKEDRIIVNRNIEKMNFKSKIKLVSKISKVLCLNNSKKIILEQSLKQDKSFTDLIYSNGIEIANSKYLFKILIKDIIDKIIQKYNIKKELSEISVTINYQNTEMLNLIKDLAKSFKSLHIVTNNIRDFIKISDKMYEESGIIVTVTNNKRKALLKTDIIINVDFTKEMLNKYAIKDNCIIINLEEDVKINKKRFCGKIINNFNIKLQKNSKIANSIEIVKYKKFDIKDLAQCYILNNPEEAKNIMVEI